MKKAKMFFLRSGFDKSEAEVNAWLAANSEIKILSTAGIGNSQFIIIYEE
jgi:hypothetical protein